MDTSANSSSTSILKLFYMCISSAEGTRTFTAWFALYLLLFPLFLFVLCICITKWWKQRHGNSASVSSSHSDVFTFHMMAVEMLMTSAAVMLMYGLYSRKDQVAITGAAMLTFSVSGQTFFHCLTCGERYLAVVHPITYLRLKKRCGVTVRNISIGVAWLLSFTRFLVVSVVPDLLPQVITGLLLISIAIVPVTFSSVSALCVLIRPGPGKKGRKRKKIDQSKRSAFITIMAILGVLLVRMVQLFVINFWYISDRRNSCFVTMTTFWPNLLSSLVLPLLFLHRAGKLPTCC